MIICRSCRTAWPDTAQFCGNCKRSFGGRRCPKGHVSPRSARFCVVCGSKELSEGTRSFSFGPTAKIGAWILAALIFKFTLPWLGVVAASLLSVANQLAGFVLGVEPIQLFVTGFCACLQIGVLIGVFALLCPGFRTQLPALGRLVGRSIRFLWGLALPVLKSSGRLLKHLVQGVKHEPKKTKSR